MTIKGKIRNYVIKTWTLPEEIELMLKKVVFHLKKRAFDKNINIRITEGEIVTKALKQYLKRHLKYIDGKVSSPEIPRGTGVGPSP